MTVKAGQNIAPANSNGDTIQALFAKNSKKFRTPLTASLIRRAARKHTE